MVSKSKRKKIDHTSSRAVTIPRDLDRGTGNYVTLAYDRLILLDPQGKIDEENLAKFFEKIEPVFWKWIEEKEEDKDE